MRSRAACSQDRGSKQQMRPGKEGDPPDPRWEGQAEGFLHNLEMRFRAVWNFLQMAG